jgi:hypothetical protein
MRSSWKSEGALGGLLRGVLVVVKKSRGGPLCRAILHFYVAIFRTLPPSSCASTYGKFNMCIISVCLLDYMVSLSMFIAQNVLVEKCILAIEVKYYTHIYWVF